MAAAVGRIVWDPKNKDIKLVIDESGRITKAYTKVDNNPETVIPATDSRVTTAITNINNDTAFKTNVVKLKENASVSVIGDYAKRNDAALKNAPSTTSANASDAQPSSAVESTFTGVRKLFDSIVSAVGLQDEKLYDPIIGGGGKNTKALVYPLDLSKEQDRMVITMYRYRNIVGTLSGSESRNIKDTTGDGKPLGYVILPMPNQIEDVNEARWQKSQITLAQLIQGGLSDFILARGQSKLKQGRQQGLSENQLSDIADKYGGIQSKINGIDADTLLSRTSGVITNPNLDLLFEGVGLRQFNYQFDLFPRNEEESLEIRNIVKLFRQGMLPRKLAANLLIGAPNTFRIRFIQGGTSDTPLADIRRHKELALTRFVADPVPGDIWMTYNDSKHSTIGFKILMTFVELTPVYYNDYFGTGDINNSDPRDINGDPLKDTIGY